MKKKLKKCPYCYNKEYLILYNGEYVCSDCIDYFESEKEIENYWRNEYHNYLDQNEI